MKNKITDLRNHLFEQLERLNDPDLTPEKLAMEGDRAAAMCQVSESIIESAKLEVKFIQALGISDMKSEFLEISKPETKALGK
jgi:hypothetical protein